MREANSLSLFLGAWAPSALVTLSLSLGAGLSTTSAASLGAESGTLFPPPLESYPSGIEAGLWETLWGRVQSEPFNAVATACFLLAIAHTFLAPRFARLSHRWRREHEARCRAGSLPGDPREIVSFKVEVMHFLGEIEVIFGLWVLPLFAALTVVKGWRVAEQYVSQGVSFTEPLFVVIIMAIAATRPVLHLAERGVAALAGAVGGSPGAWWFSILSLGPLLGSLITEPAAMTISALLLARMFFALEPAPALKYATLSLLFVNVSVGGTLTDFAAPPVLMVAERWGWSSTYLFTHFGWKAVVAILLGNTAGWLFFRGEFARLQGRGLDRSRAEHAKQPVPWWITFVHLLFLAWTVLCAHHPPLFIGGFLFFLAYTSTTAHHQTPLALRPAVLVGFFLAGLVVHGGLQGWWIEPVLTRLSEKPLLFGAMGLTAFNDNAAITYLASLVPDFSERLRYAVMAGAIAGGGLTVIANAPNPAGQSLLARFFAGGVSPLRLAAWSLPPTIIAAACFWLLP